MTCQGPPEIESISIDVTQEDIDQGIPHSTTKCPIARAINRTFGFPDSSCSVELWTGVHVMPFRAMGSRGYYEHTPESRRFVMDFDSGVLVQPATFTLKREKK